MDVLINEVLSDFNSPTTVTLVDLILSIGSSFVLSTIMARVYIMTHSGYSYSRSFTISMILVSVTIALIMIIIGSNIARAFALVGAMSIVRFRNPVKDSRDLVFVFMAIAVGMACGTQFYSFALIFTLFICAVTLGFHFTGFGLIKSRNYVLRVRMPSTERQGVEDVCHKYCDSFFVVSLDRLAGDREVEEVVYEMELRKRHGYDDLVRALSDVSQAISVSLLVGESAVEA